MRVNPKLAVPKVYLISCNLIKLMYFILPLNKVCVCNRLTMNKIRHWTHWTQLRVPKITWTILQQGRAFLTHTQIPIVYAYPVIFWYLFPLIVKLKYELKQNNFTKLWFLNYKISNLLFLRTDARLSLAFYTLQLNHTFNNIYFHFPSFFDNGSYSVFIQRIITISLIKSIYI